MLVLMAVPGDKVLLELTSITNETTDANGDEFDISAVQAVSKEIRETNRDAPYVIAGNVRSWSSHTIPTPETILSKPISTWKQAGAEPGSHLPKSDTIGITNTTCGRRSVRSFPSWQPSTAYQAGDRVSVDGARYVCTNSGTSSMSFGDRMSAPVDDAGRRWRRILQDPWWPSTTGIRPIRFHGVRMTSFDLAVLAMLYDDHQGKHNRHSAQRWMRRFADVAAVASDALEMGDRATGLRVLCEMVPLEEALKVTREPTRTWGSPRLVEDVLGLAEADGGYVTLASSHHGTSTFTVATKIAAPTFTLNADYRER